jgi:hypothetical protein
MVDSTMHVMRKKRIWLGENFAAGYRRIEAVRRKRRLNQSGGIRLGQLAV